MNMQSALHIHYLAIIELGRDFNAAYTDLLETTNTIIYYNAGLSLIFWFRYKVLHLTALAVNLI